QELAWFQGGSGSTAQGYAWRPLAPCAAKFSGYLVRHGLSQDGDTMAFVQAMEVAMENAVRQSPSLKLVGGDTDEKRVAARKYCAKLTTSFQHFSSGAEKSLQPGMLAQWKPGMKNRRAPDYDVPMIVVEVLEQPVIDSTFESGSVYFRERLDIILGFVDEDDEFYMFHYDSRRFEPYTGIGAE